MSCLTIRPIEVLLVDDQRAILVGVTALIESERPAMRVAGRAVTGRQAIDLARTIRPDVIILDADLDDESGQSLIPQFRACCDAAIVVFASISEPHLSMSAISQGASDFVPKTAPGGELIKAIFGAAAARGT